MIGDVDVMLALARITDSVLCPHLFEWRVRALLLLNCRRHSSHFSTEESGLFESREMPDSGSMEVPGFSGTKCLDFTW